MVTAIIGFKNRSDYRFENTILSLSKQTKDFELIIVDFGSTKENYEKQIEIVHKYGFKNNYRYYKQFVDKPYSMGWAHNLGVYNCNGDTVFFVGSDTFLSKNAIEVIDNSFKNDNTFKMIALPWVWLRYKAAGEVIKDFDKWLKIYEPNLLVQAKSMTHNIASNAKSEYIYGIHTHIFLSFAIQKKIMQLIGGYDLRFYGPLSEEDDVKERVERLSVKKDTECNALIYHQEHDNDGINKLKGNLVDSDLDKGIISKKYEEFNSKEMIEARFDKNRPTTCNKDEKLIQKFYKEINNYLQS